MDKGTQYKYKPTDMVIHLYMFLDTIDCELKLLRFPNQNERWIAKISNSVIQEKSELAPVSMIDGSGTNPEEAIEDYVQKIKGQTLVIGYGTKHRKKIKVPQSLFFQ